MFSSIRARHCFVMSVVALALGVVPAGAVGFTRDFDVEKCSFSPSGRDNPYFSLSPGDFAVLQGVDDGETIRVQIEVKGSIKAISFETADGHEVSLNTRVVEEREWVDGVLVEVSRNFFARCKETNDIFYFGEEVDIYEDGVIVSHDGAWEAGVDGAQPGIIIPARFLLGARYFQELAPDVALDRGENVAMGLVVKAAGQTLRGCVRVDETSPLDPPGHVSVKVYCPGAGLARDNEAKLVAFGQPN